MTPLPHSSTPPLPHSPAPARSLFSFIALTLAALLLPACASDPTQGYAFTSSHDTTVRTVAVPMFQNPTFSHGLEVELTDAIIKEIQAKTPWRVVPEGSGANTTLTGTLTDSRMRRLSTNANTGLVQELAVELTVDFDWKDSRTGKTILSRRNFVASESFVPSSPANERVEKGQYAAIERMAHDIVSELRSSW